MPIFEVTPRELNYRILVNSDEFKKVYKDEEEGHTCYTYCECDPDTMIQFKDGEIIRVEESIRTISARIELR